MSAIVFAISLPVRPAGLGTNFDPVSNVRDAVENARTLVDSGRRDQLIEFGHAAMESEYGLALGILTSNPMRGLALAEKIPTGIVHINDQTVNDEAVAPFGGVAASGTGARFGGAANIEAFTETRWITARASQAPYPF